MRNGSMDRPPPRHNKSATVTTAAWKKDNGVMLLPDPSLQRRLTSFGTLVTRDRGDKRQGLRHARYAYDVDDNDNENNYSIVAKTYALATCPLGRCYP